jgi:hypothetical protein
VTTDAQVSFLYVAGTMLVLQGSGLHQSTAGETLLARRSLGYIQRALDELADVWPAAARTAESLRKLQAEYCLEE